MDIATADQLPPPAKLIWADGTEIIVQSEDGLCELLVALPNIASGNKITLSRSRTHYITAKRWADSWSASARRGSFWTLGSFNPSFSTEWTERQVRADRRGWSLLKWLLMPPSPEQELSTGQIETIFLEFFSERKFTVPMSGA